MGLPAVLAAAACLPLLSACHGAKGVKPPPVTTSAFDNGLVSRGQEDVRKKLGDPTVVEKTPENNILWVYAPKWKILPNDKGTLYVEFKDGKVTKIFRKQ